MSNPHFCPFHFPEAYRISLGVVYKNGGREKQCNCGAQLHPKPDGIWGWGRHFWGEEGETFLPLEKKYQF